MFIQDDYEHTDLSLEYVLENVLSEAALNGNDIESKALCDEYNSVLLNFCKCHDECGNADTCMHGGNYVLYNLGGPHPGGELVLNKTLRKDIFYECCNECQCDNRKCQNRLIQFGPRKGCLQIIESEIYKSKGLATTTDIPCGSFICEYAGELLTAREAEKRAFNNQKEGKMNYIICLNEFSQETSAITTTTCYKTFVDPSQKGNIGRYINHSCNPNCEIFSIRVGCPIPKLGIFSKRFIRSGEELSFHYGDDQEQNTGAVIESNQRVPCLCKSNNCLKFLPNIKF